jgi:DNA-binding NtrC family response regulator
MNAWKKPPGIETNLTQIVTVLSVSPIEEDHVFLENSFKNQAEWTQFTKSKWVLYRAFTLGSALNALQENRIAIAVCDVDLLWTTSTQFLDQLSLYPNCPYLIVSSRLANDCLWAEALHRGAYDVLAKPFDKHEVIRILSSAWTHWKAQHDLPARVSKHRIAG